MKKFWLYFHTIKHLKSQQVFYLLWYKFKKHFPLKEPYLKYNDATIKRLHFDAYELIHSKGKYQPKNNFCFLNTNHNFTSTIDWNIQIHGKLWNYNLQYFDFIFDEQFQSETFYPLIENCSESILKNKLQLEPYPVSLRLINWLLFFSKTGYNSENFQKAIKVQLAFLEKNLEVQLLGNHYFENLVSLLIAALYFNDQKLLNKAIRKLKKQLEEQILDDGAHYECSPMYHVILLSRLLIVYRLIQCNDLEINIQIQLEKAISKMEGWLSAFCFKNGKYPLFNDAAYDVAISIKTINSEFQKTGLKTALTSLNESGYRKFSNDNFEILIDVGNILPPYQPGHLHSDMLSFCMNFFGVEIFIDPGVSTYEINEQRLKERGTEFHNTVTINNENQSQIWASFRMAKRAKLIIEKDERNCCKAYHDGYSSKYGVIVSRQFQLLSNKFEISDKIVGNETVESVAHFYLHPDVSIIQSENSSVKLNNTLLVNFEGCNSLKISTISIPNGYNRFKQTQKIEITFNNNLLTRITSDN